jgi:hypothetical protein
VRSGTREILGLFTVRPRGWRGRGAMEGAVRAGLTAAAGCPVSAAAVCGSGTSAVPPSRRRFGAWVPRVGSRRRAGVRRTGFDGGRPRRQDRAQAGSGQLPCGDWWIGRCPGSGGTGSRRLPNSERSCGDPGKTGHCEPRSACGMWKPRAHSARTVCRRHAGRGPVPDPRSPGPGPALREYGERYREFSAPRLSADVVPSAPLHRTAVRRPGTGIAT